MTACTLPSYCDLWQAEVHAGIGMSSLPVAICGCGACDVCLDQMQGFGAL